MTIEYSPPDYASVHNDLIYTVSDAHTSDPVTYPNYKFIADIYINGAMIARLRKFPNPVTNIGIFNISREVGAYLSVVFNPTTALQSQELGRGEFYVDLQVKFGEEYSYTSYFNLATSTSQKVYNNYNKLLFGDDSSLEDYPDNVITNMPLRSEVFSNQDYALITYFPTDTSSVTIDIQPDNGSLYSTNITPSTAHFGQVLNVSPNTINALSPGTINGGTSYYDVTIGGETYRYWLTCSAYEIYPVYFLNQYGGFDTKLFTKVSRKRVKIERSMFSKLPYTVDSGGDVSYYNGQVQNEEQSVYSVLFTEQLILNTNFLTDAEYNLQLYR